MAIRATSTRSAQMLRPLYDFFANQPELLSELQSTHGLPPIERIGEECERLATEQVVSLLRDLALSRGYADIGLTLGSSLPVGCFGSLSFLLLSSATFHDMLDNLCHYHGIIAHGDRSPHWTQAGREFYLELFIPQGAEDIQTVRSDFVIASAHGLIQHAAPGLYMPTRVAVGGSGDDYRHRYRECFNTGELEFNSDTLRLYGPVELLDTPLPSANPSLCKVFRKELDVLLRALNADQTIIDQIQQLMAQADNLAKVSLGGIAEALSLGERTLARQLAEYDITFRDLLANYKSTRAIRLLAEGQTVDQVSYYLGFSERAAFDRAFKKWQGVTASRFQDDYRHSGAREVDVLDNEQLPNLPMVANQLLKLLDENSYEMEEVAMVVEQDPALTAKLLALANSAMYGVVQASSIKDAIIRVFGVDTLRNLALAMLANACFDTSRCRPFSLKTYWINALATGQLAAEVAKASGCADPSQSYLLGLLHNIGTLLLVQSRPEDMAQVLGQEGLLCTPLTQICKAEKAVLGIDACAAGSMLAAFWNLPRYLQVAIRVLMDRDYSGEAKELVQLVAASEYVVRQFTEGGDDTFFARQQLAQAAAMDEDSLAELLDEFRSRHELIEAAAAGLV